MLPTKPQIHKVVWVYLREIRIQHKKYGFGYEWSFAILSIFKSNQEVGYLPTL